MPSPAENPSVRVVVVDDTAILRQRLVSMINRTPGVEVIGQAGDTQSAIDTIATLHPHAVVLDLQIPGGSGLDVLAFIRREYPETRVIVLTNHSSPFFKKKCLQQGASHFLDKTLEFDQVGRALMNVS